MPTSLPPVTIRVKPVLRWLLLGIFLVDSAIAFWSSWQVNMAWRAQIADPKAWTAFIASGLLSVLFSGGLCLFGWSYRIIITETEIRLDGLITPARNFKNIIALEKIFSIQSAGGLSRLQINAYLSDESSSLPEKAMTITAGIFEGGPRRLTKLLRQRLPPQKLSPGLSKADAWKWHPATTVLVTLWGLAGAGILIYLAYVFTIFPLLRSQTAWHTRQRLEQDDSIGHPTSFDRSGQFLSAAMDRSNHRIQVCRTSRTSQQCWLAIGPEDIVFYSGIYLDGEDRPLLLGSTFDESAGPLLRWTENGFEAIDYPLQADRPLDTTPGQIWASTMDATTGQPVIVGWEIATGQIERYPAPEGYSQADLQWLNTTHTSPYLKANHGTGEKAESEIYVWQGNRWQASGYAQTRPVTASPHITSFTVMADGQLYILAENNGAAPYIVGRLAQDEWEWTEIEPPAGETLEPYFILVDGHGRIWLTSSIQLDIDSIYVYQPNYGQAARLLVSYTTKNSNYPRLSRPMLGPDGTIWATGGSYEDYKTTWIDGNAANLPRPLPDWLIVKGDEPLLSLILGCAMLAWLWITRLVFW